MGEKPVRESILRLEGEGLLQRDRDHCSRRVRVKYIDDQDPHEVLARYELREAIEGQAARLASQNMNAWQVDELRRRLNALNAWKESDGIEKLAEVSIAFHEYLLAECGNSLLLKVWREYGLSPMTPDDGAV
jgi:DNA-binding GntR family transcriptional regulator